MTNANYLTNAIAGQDIQVLMNETIHTSAAPSLLFSMEQLSGGCECIVVEKEALHYASVAKIEDTKTFSNALIKYAESDDEVFFEAAYNDFINVFPFKNHSDIERIGIQVIPSIEGFRFQTLTLLDNGDIMHDPYYMFLSAEKIRLAANATDSNHYSQLLFEAMLVEFPGPEPTPGSEFEKLVNASIPISATLATIGIRLLALRVEHEMNTEQHLPVLQEGEEIPKIVSLTIP